MNSYGVLHLNVFKTSYTIEAVKDTVERPVTKARTCCFFPHCQRVHVMSCKHMRDSYVWPKSFLAVRRMDRQQTRSDTSCA